MAVERPFKAYRFRADKKPFVFVSYSHSDKDRVYPILQRLHQEGLRIWYDEGIPVATHFFAEIQEAIEKCEHFLVFLSDNAVQSPNVRNEITLAHEEEHRDKQKRILPVYLEPAELKYGLRLLLVGVHGIQRYRGAGTELTELSDEDFVELMRDGLPEAVWEMPRQTEQPGGDEGTDDTCGAGAGQGEVQPPPLPPTPPPVKIDWVRIPAGSFIRGCPPRFIEELASRGIGNVREVFGKHPERREQLGEFWIAKTPVTAAQYLAFVEATGHRTPKDWPGAAALADPARGNLPVVGVSWQDGIDFAAWLGARLPTRAEAEKACRGDDGRLYPWGDAFDAAKCSAGESSESAPTPVGSFPDGASPYGILDLVGNVWEWVFDAEADGTKMIVGASFRASGEVFGAGFFNAKSRVDLRDNDLGFRVACDDPRALRPAASTS